MDYMGKSICSVSPGRECDKVALTAMTWFLTACAPERAFLRLALVCDEGDFRNSEGPSVSLKKRFLFMILFCAVPDFVKTNTLKVQTTTIIKETLCGSPLWSKQTWLISRCLNTHCLPMVVNCSSSFPHHPASAGRDKRNLFNPALTLAEFEAHYQAGMLNLEPKWLPWVRKGGREYSC